MSKDFVHSKYHCLIALGANLGNPSKTFQRAVEKLNQFGIHVEKISNLYQTKPENCGDQPDFTNAVLLAQTSLEPQQLLKCLLEIEKQLGRVRNPQRPHGPRTLDLDLLLVDNLILNTPNLALPHPRMHLRRFVLEPACELVPLWVHPELKKNLQTLLLELE